MTEEHIVAEKISKMRIKSATQIFSHSVAVVTSHLIARGTLHYYWTICLIALMCISDGIIYKGVVRRTSPHHQLWQKAKKILKL